MNKDFICICGEQLRFIHDSSGCGDLRCISCMRSSGYCGSIIEAIEEFKRIYKIKS